MTASDELRLGGDHNRQINYRKKNNNNKTIFKSPGRSFLSISLFVSLF